MAEQRKNIDSSAASRVELSKHWTRAYPLILSFIRASINDFHRCEDVLQEVPVAVAESFDNYDTNRPFEAWAMGIARNKVLYYLRTASKEQLTFGGDTIEALAIAHIATAHELPERQKFLRQCIRNLRDRRKQILELRYLRGASLSEIASLTKISTNAVSILLHRIRKQLRLCVETKLSHSGGPDATQGGPVP